MLTFKSLPTPLKPREKLLSGGVFSLSLEDIIALLIRTGSRSEDVLQTSSRVAFSLESGRVSMTELSLIPGLGPAKAAVIVAALELEKALEQRKGSTLLLDADEIYRSCTDLLSEPQEHLVVFFLSARGSQIKRHTVSIGTATASLVHAREVFRPAILYNATHVVMAHNHPSGSERPSDADLQATKQMVVAGREVGIELLDHVVCGKREFTSIRGDFPELFF